MPRRARAVLLGLTMSLAACADDQPTLTVVDTFTGQLSSGSVSAHSFFASSDGDVVVGFDTLSGSGITIGAYFGTPDGDGCVEQASYAPVTEASELVLSIGEPGDYCVALYDIGLLGTVTIDYEITVVHP
ncbi:MAG: hypothetical protein GKS06_10765 [Acidobacteria bacterium]|nr:hypothetical protein [Acidobacteriota bacterium]